MCRSDFRWKWTHCLVGVVITISLAFAPPNGSDQIEASANDGNINTAVDGSDIDDSGNFNNTDEDDENGDTDEDSANGDDENADTDKENAGGGNENGDSDEDNADGDGDSDSDADGDNENGDTDEDNADDGNENNADDENESGNTDEGNSNGDGDSDGDNENDNADGNDENGDTDKDNTDDDKENGDTDEDNADEDSTDGNGDTDEDNGDGDNENGDTDKDNAIGDGENSDTENIDGDGYEVESVQDPYYSVGGISLSAVPDLFFGEVKLDSLPRVLQVSMSGNVQVSDVYGEGWNLSVRYESLDNKLPGRLFFKQGGFEQDISESSQIIYCHIPDDFDEDETIVTKEWDNEDEGFWLEVSPEDIAGYDISDKIVAKLIWEIAPIVE